MTVEAHIYVVRIKGTKTYLHNPSSNEFNDGLFGVKTYRKKGPATSHVNSSRRGWSAIVNGKWVEIKKAGIELEVVPFMLEEQVQG